MNSKTAKFAHARMMDFEWFSDQYRDLQNQYGDTFLSIKDRHVIGCYPSYAEAVRETSKIAEIGTFIVQECTAHGPMKKACIASMNF